MATMTLYASEILVNNSSSGSPVYTWTDYTTSGTPYVASHGNGTPQNCQLKFGANPILASSAVHNITFNYYVSAITDTSTDTKFSVYPTNTNKHSIEGGFSSPESFPPIGGKLIGQTTSSGWKSADITSQWVQLSSVGGIWYLLMNLGTSWGGSAKLSLTSNASASKMNVVINYTPPYTACTAPNAISVSNNNVRPDEMVTLSWSGAAGGTANAISGYDIYRSTSVGSGYALLMSVTSTSSAASTSVSAPMTKGATYYYKVVTKGVAGAAYHSGQSSAYAALSTAPYGNTVGYYQGGAMILCEIYYFNGSEWMECIPYYRHGGGWKECHSG